MIKSKEIKSIFILFILLSSCLFVFFNFYIPVVKADVLAPDVTTNTTTNVEETTATLNGYLVNDGNENCTTGFQYGLTTGYGTNASTSDIITAVGAGSLNEYWIYDLELKASASEGYGGDIWAVAGDATYYYIGGDITAKIYQYWKSNLTKKAESASYGNGIWAVEEEGDYVYGAGSQGSGPGYATSKVYQYYKSNLSKVAESPSYGGQIYALAQDDTYIYAGGQWTNAVTRYWKSNMTADGTTYAYTGVIEDIVLDDTYLYVAGSSTNKVYQYWINNGTKKAETIAYGSTIFALADDENYVYAGGTVTQKVYKFQKSDMSKVAESVDYNENIYALATDEQYVYYGGTNTRKLLKSSLSQVDSSSYGGTILDFTFSEKYLNSGEELFANITGLSPGTLYHYRAYANNSNSTSYGSDSIFLTKPNAPTNMIITDGTPNALNLTWTKGTGANTTYIERNTTSNWTIGEGTVAYNGTLTYYNDTGLTAGTTYYYQAWSFTTWDVLNQWSDTYASGNHIVYASSNVTTNTSTDVEETTATLNGYLEFDGNESCTVGFEVGTNTSYGKTVSTSGYEGYVFISGNYPVTGSKLYKYTADNLTEIQYVDVTGAIQINAIVQDDTFIYVGGIVDSSYVRKYWKSNLTLALTSPVGFGSVVTSMVTDENYIYVATEASRTVRKANKNDLVIQASTPNYGATIFSVDIDDTYVYVVGHQNTGYIRRYLKSDMSYVSQSALLSYSLYKIVVDGNYLYVGGANGYIRKYTKALSYVSQTSSSFGSIIRDFAIDDKYILAVGDTGGAIFEQYWKSNMTRKTNITDGTWIGMAYNSFAICDAGEYVYISIITNESKNVTFMYNKNDLTASGRKAISDENINTIYSSIVAPNLYSSLTNFSYNLSTLPGTLYHYRATAENTANISYGNDSAFLTKPEGPTNLIITDGTPNTLNLTWTKGTGANNTYIERNATGVITPWVKGTGTTVYNGTLNYYNDTGLAPGTYYYQAWSYTEWDTLSQFSDNYSSGNYNALATPNVSTDLATLIGNITTQLNGILVDTGGEPCTVRFEYGLDTSYGTNTTNQTVGTGTFLQSISGLTQATLYHYRAVANNTIGTNYGEDKTLLTKPEAPTNLIIQNTAPGQQSLSWSHGTGYNRSVIRRNAGSYPTSPDSGIAVYNNTGNSTTASGLSSDDWYYTVWEYASEDGLFQYSDANASNHLPPLRITTNDSTNVTSVSATLNGCVYVNGIAWFEYGLTESYGTETSNQSVTTGNEFSENLVYLSSSILYHYRAVVQEGVNTYYGEDKYFLTKPVKPTNLTATVVNTTIFNISWTKATGANTTYIEYTKDNPSFWSRGSGTLLYNGTENYYVHNGLTSGTYYYQAWSYSAYSGNYSLHHFSDDYDSDWMYTLVPGVQTLPATGVEETNVTLNGYMLNNQGEYCLANYQWGLNSYSNYYNTSFYAISSPSTLPVDRGSDIDFSSDSTYMAVSFYDSPCLYIYKRSGDTYTKLTNPSTTPAGQSTGVAFSDDDTYLAVAHANSPYITIYKRSGDTFTKLSDPGTLPTNNAQGVCWSHGGTYLVVVHITSPYVTIYKRSGDTFTKLSNPATLPTGTGKSCDFSYDDVYLSIAHINSPYATIYKRSGDTFTNLSITPTALPGANGEGTAFSSTSSTYLAFAMDASPRLAIYKRSGDAFSQISAPDIIPEGTGLGQDVDFSQDDRYLATSFLSSPCIAIYERNGDNFSRLPAPEGTTLGGQKNKCEFSADERYLGTVWYYDDPHMRVYRTGYVAGETFTYGLSGLSPGILYHYRVNAKINTDYGYGNDMTFLTKPYGPSGLTSVPISDSQVNLNWTKGSGANQTVILRKNSSYPTNITDGTYVYIGNGTNCSDIDSFTYGATYYYRAWSYNTEGELTQISDTNVSSSVTMIFIVYEPSAFFAEKGRPVAINLSWIKGLSSSHTYIMYKSGAVPPTSRTDGYLLYNDTGTDLSIIGLTPGAVYSFSAWGYNNLVNLFSTNYTTITAQVNNPPIIDYPNPNNQSTNVDIITSQFTISMTDGDGELFSWSLTSSPNYGTASASGASNGTKTLTFISTLPYSTTITITATANDGHDIITNTYWFTTRIQYVPIYPSPFTATATSTSTIDLSWTKGTYADNTYIRYKQGTSAPTSLTDGTFLYNGTGTSTTATALSTSTYYSFSAWSWNEIDKIYSTSYSQRTAQTLSSSPIEISVTTNDATNVEETTATMNGLLTSDGGQPTDVWFEYGLNPDFGSNTTPQTKTAGQSFSENLIILSPGIKYYFRAVADNSLSDITYGSTKEFLTKPSAPPGSFKATSYNNNRIDLSWSKPPGATHTYIVRKENSYPASRTDGTVVYEGTASSYSDITLSGLKKYYYRTWSMAIGSTQYSDDYSESWNWTLPAPPTNIDAHLIPPDTLNITWTKSVDTNITVVVFHPSHYPETVTDGTLIYNGTAENVTDYNITAPIYYSLFAYAEVNGTPLYSRYALVGFGGMFVNCYDEATFVDLTFDIFVTNEEGTDTYTDTGLVNTHMIPTNELPFGEKIAVQINASGYKTRYYYMEIEENNWYTLNAYLPKTDDAKLYLITVINQYDFPVENVKVITKAKNQSDVYTAVSTLYTDANGQINLYLLPEHIYKWELSHPDYVTAYPDYIPSSEIFTHTFRIDFTEAEPSEPEKLFNNLEWTIEPEARYHHDGFTVYYNITSSDNQLQFFRMDVWTLNESSWTWIQLYNSTVAGSPGGGTISYYISNETGQYHVSCYFKKYNFSETEVTQEGSRAYFISWGGLSTSPVFGAIPDWLYMLVIIIIMIVVMAYLLPYAGLATGYIGIGIFGFALGLKPDLALSVGPGDPISGWFVLVVTAIVYTIALFIWSRI